MTSSRICWLQGQTLFSVSQFCSQCLYFSCPKPHLFLFLSWSCVTYWLAEHVLGGKLISWFQSLLHEMLFLTSSMKENTSKAILVGNSRCVSEEELNKRTCLFGQNSEELSRKTSSIPLFNISFTNLFYFIFFILRRNSESHFKSSLFTFLLPSQTPCRDSLSHGYFVFNQVSIFC